MNKKVIMIVCICSVTIFGILMFNIIKKTIMYNVISSDIVKFINSEIKSNWLDANSFDYLHYAKSIDTNHYDCTKFVNNYIEIINNCVKNKENGKSEIEISQYEYLGKSPTEISIYGLNDNCTQYIMNLISDNDIKNYKKGIFVKEIQKQLKKVLEYDEHLKLWFISGNEDKMIDLPYNVYINYVPNKKVDYNKCKKILNFKFLENIPKIVTKNNNHIKCIVEYEDYNGRVIKDNVELVLVHDAENNIKINLYYVFRKLYYSDSGGATLTAGQHDYDEALIKEKEWEAEIGLNGDMSYLNVNGNIDKEEKETEHYLTDEEFEKVFKEINKKYGIE